MRRFNITSEMVKGFTAEIEKNIEKINSKDGFAIADFRATAKGGKVTELPDGEKRISITVSMLYPYTVCLGTGAKKTRMNIFFDADMKIISSCGNILNYVAEQLEYLNSYVEEVKKYGVDSITEQIYPDLADTIEKYGFEWFERKFAEFQQYLDSLVETKEEEKIDFAYMVEEFNDAIKLGVEAIFNEACDQAERHADSDMGEYISTTMDYDYDIEKMWVEYCLEEGLMGANEAYDYYRANRDMFLDLDDLDEIVEGLDGTDDVGDGECLVWVKNPYYDPEEQVENDAPCLDDEDRIDRILAVVRKHWVENTVDEHVKLDWSLFEEEDMEKMFENEEFAREVYDEVTKINRFFSECLAYDDCFYIWLSEDIKTILIDYIYNLDYKPSWVNRDSFVFADGGDYLDIIMFGSYHIALYYDPSESGHDCIWADAGGYGKADLEYAIEILENRDKILSLAGANKLNIAA